MAIMALAGLTACGPPGSSGGGAPARLITNGAWETTPTRAQADEAYPDQARDEGIEGRAIAGCTVGEAGLLKACVIDAESPVGAGFGEAAIGLMKHYKMKPQTAGGHPTAGGRVAVPVNFFLGDDEPAPTGPPARETLDWLSAPTIAQWSAAYPTLPASNPIKPIVYSRKGRERDADGTAIAILKCRIDPNGRLTACRVDSESPQQAGVGDAAKSLIPYFRAPSEDQFGVTAGAPVSLMITFPGDPAGRITQSLTEPTPSARPSYGQVEAAFPAKARAAHLVGGEAAVRCRRDDAGWAKDCVVVTERPPNMGFGEAVMSLSPTFRFTLWSYAGTPTSTTGTLNIAFGQAEPSTKPAIQLRQEVLNGIRINSLGYARQSLEQLGQRFPHDETLVLLHDMLGGALQARQRYEDAIWIYGKSAPMNGGVAAAYNSMCWIKATQEIQLGSALADCDAAIRLSPQASDYLDSRGFLHLRQGDYDKAIADYDASLRLVPTQTYSLMGRGIAKIRSGDRAGGRADVDAALAKSPELAAVFASYGIRP